MITQQGFFIKISDVTYKGPFDRLQVARDEARVYGNSVSIYHGILKRISDSIVDDSQLFLVPKVDK